MTQRLTAGLSLLLLASSLAHAQPLPPDTPTPGVDDNLRPGIEVLHRYAFRADTSLKLEIHRSIQETILISDHGRRVQFEANLIPSGESLLLVDALTAEEISALNKAAAAAELSNLPRPSRRDGTNLKLHWSYPNQILQTRAGTSQTLIGDHAGRQELMRVMDGIGDRLFARAMTHAHGEVVSGKYGKVFLKSASGDIEIETEIRPRALARNLIKFQVTEGFPVAVSVTVAGTFNADRSVLTISGQEEDYLVSPSRSIFDAYVVNDTPLLVVNGNPGSTAEQGGRVLGPDTVLQEVLSAVSSNIQVSGYRWPGDRLFYVNGVMAQTTGLHGGPAGLDGILNRLGR